MRKIPTYMINKLKDRIHTSERSSNIETNIKVSRPTTPLKDVEYLEKLEISGGMTTDCSIAVRHPRANRRNTEIDIMFVQNGVAKWIKSTAQYQMEDYVFIDMGFEEPAIKCSICYDSITEITKNDNVEMVTNGSPWLFWISPSGVIYAQKGLDSQTKIELASSNGTDISTVRGMWHSNPIYDYGLIAVFLLNGTPYYRQLQHDIWTDGTPLNFGPSGPFTDISLSRTWDTRIILQMKHSNGKTYSMFSKQQAFGKNDLGETLGHVNNKIKPVSIELKGIKELPPVKSPTHTLGITKGECVSLHLGVFKPELIPKIIDVYNYETLRDYGKEIMVIFDPYGAIDTTTWKDAEQYFKLTDSRGFVYSPYKVLFDNTKSTNIKLLFENFNSARGECVVSYTSGFLKNMEGSIIPSCEYSFTPIGLVPPSKPGPIPIGVSYSKDGLSVTIEFDKNIYCSDIKQNLDKIKVYVIKPKYPDPDATPIEHKRTPIEIQHDRNKITLLFEDTNNGSIRDFNNVETHVSYGGGNLVGNYDEDIVLSFDSIFYPTGMTPKNDQWTGAKFNTIPNIQMNIELKGIKELPPVKSPEHILGNTAFKFVDLKVTLTHIDDI